MNFNTPLFCSWIPLLLFTNPWWVPVTCWILRLALVSRAYASIHHFSGISQIYHRYYHKHVYSFKLGNTLRNSKRCGSKKQNKCKLVIVCSKLSRLIRSCSCMGIEVKDLCIVEQRKVIYIHTFAHSYLRFYSWKQVLTSHKNIKEVKLKDEKLWEILEWVDFISNLDEAAGEKWTKSKNKW